MDRYNPLTLIIVGSVLVMIGWGLPFLTVLGVIEANFPLLFLSYAALLLGMMVGIVGALMYGRRRRDREEF